MNAIYGERGVKAGFMSGECIDDVIAAVDELSERGVEVIVLGCTELPLLLPDGEMRSSSGRVVNLVDPTDVLAEAMRGVRAWEGGGERRVGRAEGVRG